MHINETMREFLQNTYSNYKDGKSNCDIRFPFSERAKHIQAAEYLRDNGLVEIITYSGKRVILKLTATGVDYCTENL